MQTIENLALKLESDISFEEPYPAFQFEVIELEIQSLSSEFSPAAESMPRQFLGGCELTPAPQGHRQIRAGVQTSTAEGNQKICRVIDALKTALAELRCPAFNDCEREIEEKNENLLMTAQAQFKTAEISSFAFDNVFAGFDLYGSPRLVVDSQAGEIAQQIDYDEFGQVISDSNPGFQPFGLYILLTQYLLRPLVQKVWISE